MMKHTTAFFLAALVAGAMAFTAAGFDYDEAVQGDIRSQGRKEKKPPLFRLELGTNVIRGSTGYSPPSIFDWDQFMIRVPKGAELRLDSTVYDYRVTGVDGDVRAFGTALEIEPWRSRQGAEGHYSTGSPAGPFFYLFNDGSFPALEVAPSPAALSFFEVIDSSVDLTRPVSLLPADDYRVMPGFTALGLGEFAAFWDYAITFVVTPAL